MWQILFNVIIGTLALGVFFSFCGGASGVSVEAAAAVDVDVSEITGCLLSQALLVNILSWRVVWLLSDRSKTCFAEADL